MSEENLAPADQPPVEEPKTVDFSAYEATKNDMHKWKRQSQESERELKELRAQLEQRNKEELEGQQQYKALWEQSEAAKEKAEQKLNQVYDGLIKDKKVSSALDYARSLGLVEGAEEDLIGSDMSDIVVETTDQGSFLVHGSKEWVDRKFEAKKHWFTKPVVPPINNGVGQYQPGQAEEYTPKQMLNLQKEDPAKYREIMQKRRNLIKRS